MKSRSIDSKENFIFTITQFKSGFTYNVFPDEAYMCGSIRTYKEELKPKLFDKIRNICEKSAETFNCKAEVTFTPVYPATINHPE